MIRAAWCRGRFCLLLLATLVPAGCAEPDGPFSPPPQTVDDVRVTLRVEDRADRLVVNLEIHNTRTTERLVRFAANCSPVVRLYRSTNATGQPAWDESRWQAQSGVCLPVLRNAQLVGRGTIGLRHELTDAQMLGDSLNAGTWHVFVEFTMSEPGALFDLRGGPVRLAR